MPRNLDMHTLRLHCPALTYLDIRACMVLREIELEAPALTTLKMEYCPDIAFASLPADILKRLQPCRGIRTERGGEEASVRHTSLMRPELCSIVTSTAESQASSADLEAEAASQPLLSAGSDCAQCPALSEPVDEDSDESELSSPRADGVDKVPSIVWRLQRLRESLTDITLTESSRAAIQRQIERQQAMLAALTMKSSEGFGDRDKK
jgi:hypothetical protein